MKKQKAIQEYSDEALSGKRDYNTLALGIAYNQLKELEFSCEHCNKRFRKKDNPCLELKNRHQIRITKKRVSFTCPCHLGWILSLSKKEIPFIFNLNLDKK